MTEVSHRVDIRPQLHQLLLPSSDYLCCNLGRSVIILALSTGHGP
jgi:hypothetical protein